MRNRLHDERIRAEDISISGIYLSRYSSSRNVTKFSKIPSLSKKTIYTRQFEVIIYPEDSVIFIRGNINFERNRIWQEQKSEQFGDWKTRLIVNGTAKEEKKEQEMLQEAIGRIGGERREKGERKMNFPPIDITLWFA